MLGCSVHTFCAYLCCETSLPCGPFKHYASVGREISAASVEVGPHPSRNIRILGEDWNNVYWW